MNADADRAPRVAGQVPALAAVLSGHEPPRAVDPHGADAVDVRAAVGVDRRQPAWVPVGPAGIGRHGDALVEPGFDGGPFHGRQVVEVCEVLCFHAL